MSQAAVQEPNPQTTPDATPPSESQDPEISLTSELESKLNELSLEDKNNTTSPQKEEEEEAEQSKEDEHTEEVDYYTRDLVDISKVNISFNKNILYPGSIDEVEVVIGLKDEVLPDEDPKAAYLLRVIAVCHNAEFNDLDEYVFSVRSNQRFQYFEEVRFRIRKRERAQVRVAVKVPSVKQNYTIQGTLSVQLENTVPLFLPIMAKCEIPKIICLKELFEVSEGVQMIKIPAKKNMRMPPIPFKNLSAFNFILEVETATTEDLSNRPYDVISQNSANCLANSQFFVNMQLKTNPNYRGPMPKTDTLRKILILKVKNSSVYFSYPIEAYIYESSNGSAMS